jgi:D-psicose/D-tagatose/L-ribulose 3-epimerase
MPRLGAHAFVWEAEWTPATARRVVASAAAAGLDFLEIPLLEPGTVNVQATREVLAASGLGVTCSLGLPLGASLTEPPQAGIAFLEQAVDVAAELGSALLTGVIYASLSEPPQRPVGPREFDAIADSLRRVALRAADRGVRLGIEPVNRYETSVVNTAAQGLELIAAIDEPNVVLHLDTYHMNIEEKGFGPPIRSAAANLGYVHLAESDRGVPGTGNVPWDEVFEALADIRFEGDLAFEYFAGVNPLLARATCIWRPLVPSGDDVAAATAGYLRDRASGHGLRI